jgi:2-aminoadipate transaminase
MRLNFSGVDENLIREGIRRIGKVVRELTALYGTLTGERRAPAAPAEPAPNPREDTSGRDRPLADVLRLPTPGAARNRRASRGD